MIYAGVLGAVYSVTCLVILIYSCCSLDDSLHTLLNFFALILSSVNGVPVLILYGKYTSSVQFWSGYPVVTLNVSDIRPEGRLLVSEPRNETSSLFLQATGGNFNKSTFFYRAVFDQLRIKPRPIFPATSYPTLHPDATHRLETTGGCFSIPTNATRAPTATFGSSISTTL